MNSQPANDVNREAARKMAALDADYWASKKLMELELQIDEFLEANPEA